MNFYKIFINSLTIKYAKTVSYKIARSCMDVNCLETTNGVIIEDIVKNK